MSNVPSKSQLLIYQSDDGTIKIDVRFENETVWLTQPLMAELFQTTQQNISLHLQNIYEEGELGLEATHKKILSVLSPATHCSPNPSTSPNTSNAWAPARAT